MNKLDLLYYPDTGQLLTGPDDKPVGIDDASDEQAVALLAQVQEHRRRTQDLESALRHNIMRRMRRPRSEGGWGDVDAARIGAHQVTLKKSSRWDVEDLTSLCGELIGENLLTYAQREKILKRKTEVTVDGNEANRLRRELPADVKPRLDACRTFARSIEVRPTAIEASAEEAPAELEAST